jgi:Spy/CpxP family protein refolding chaperone
MKILGGTKMGKGVWLRGLAVAALMAAAATVRAQDDNAAMGGDDKPGMHDGTDDGMDGGMMRGRWGGGFKEKLGLTDDQATKLKDFFKKQRENNAPLRDQMRIDMDTLRQKVDMKASDSDIKRLLDKLVADRKDMQAARQKSEDQLREMLTPTQQAKLLFMMRRGLRGMGGWKDHDDWNKGKGDHMGGSKGKHRKPDAEPTPADSGN